MRVITLEDHFTTPMANSLLPPLTPQLAKHLEGVNEYLGFDSEAALLDLSERPLRNVLVHDGTILIIRLTPKSFSRW